MPAEHRGLEPLRLLRGDQEDRVERVVECQRPRLLARRELDGELFDSGVLCQAFDEKNFEIGHLLIDGDGKILGIEVEREHRRKGIATRMLRELRAAGYRVELDWENLRPDGAGWVRGLGDDVRGLSVDLESSRRRESPAQTASADERT